MCKRVTHMTQGFDRIHFPGGNSSRSGQDARLASLIDQLTQTTALRAASRIQPMFEREFEGTEGPAFSADDIATLDALLTASVGSVTTPFNRLKQTPSPARAGT